MTTSDLAKEIQDEVQKRLTVMNHETPCVYQTSEESNTRTALFIAMLMLFMSLCFIGLLWYKKQGGELFSKSILPASAVNGNKDNDTNKRLTNLEKRVDTTEQKLDVITNRQWALGIAFNNNVSIQDYTIRKTDPELAEKLVWVDEDWKLNREPAFVQLDDESRRQLLRMAK